MLSIRDGVGWEFRTLFSVVGHLKLNAHQAGVRKTQASEHMWF